MEDNCVFVTKNKNMAAVQYPVWHCTDTFQKVERIALLFIAFIRLVVVV